MPISKFLVVCGGTIVTQDWFFGNFVSFCKVLGRLGATGDFLSISPIKDFFARPDYDTIKFGLEGNQNSAMEIFPKYEFEHREPFFTQYDDENLLLKDTLDFILAATQTLEPGDSFTIVLIGHGNPTGVLLGDNSFIKKEVLVQLISGFKPSIQVNLVVQSCASGCFVDAFQASNQRQRRYVHTSADSARKSCGDTRSPSGRFRNSVFSGAFLKHLGFAYDQTANEWTLGGHIAAVRRDTRYPRDPATASDPQTYTGNLSLLAKFVEVLYANYIDRSFNFPHAARRILTPTSQDFQGIPAQQGIPPPEPPFVPSEALESTIELMEAEIKLVGDRVDENDMEIASIGSRAKWARGQKRINDKIYGERLASQLALFRWRFRIQEQFLFAFQSLEAKDLVSIDHCFKYPIAWEGISATVQMLFCALSYFEIANECTSIKSSFGLFDAPVLWLAVAIARTSSNVAETFENLCKSGTLGNFDQARFEDDIGKKLDTKVNPQEMACDEQKNVPQIGFWLPQNIMKGRSYMHLWADSVWDRYRLIVKGYEQSHGKGSWGDCELIQDSLKYWIDGKESK